MYEAAARMRKVPVGRSAIFATVVPLAIPFLAIAALQIPLKDLLLKLAKVLV